MANGSDLSGWSFQELTPGSSTPATDQAQVEPQIGKHTPEDYATLTTQNAVQRMHDQGLMPEVGTAQDIFKTALSRAQDFQKSQAEVSTEYQKQLQRLVPSIPTPAGKESLVSLEEKEKAAVAQQKTQFEQGPGAMATAAAQAAAGHPGLVKELPEADTQKLDMLTHGYDAVNDLSGSFNYMMSGKPQVDNNGKPVAPPLGTGGQFASLGGHLRWFADATSASALNFDRQREQSMIPIARAVLGEVGATPTKAQMVDMALQMGLPLIQDDQETGNNQIYNYKKTILDQLKTLHDNRTGNYDTSKSDAAIAKYNSDFRSPTTQAWNPIQTSKSVVLGNSQAAQNAYANVNQGALAGTYNAQPTGYVSGYGTASGGPQQPPVIQPRTTPTNPMSNLPGRGSAIIMPQPGTPLTSTDITNPFSQLPPGT